MLVPRCSEYLSPRSQAYLACRSVIQVSGIARITWYLRNRLSSCRWIQHYHLRRPRRLDFHCMFPPALSTMRFQHQPPLPKSTKDVGNASRSPRLFAKKNLMAADVTTFWALTEEAYTVFVGRYSGSRGPDGRGRRRRIARHSRHLIHLPY